MVGRTAIAGAVPKTSVQVLVLGDIGRSPRMQYHAISIAKSGGRVDLIGYRESEIHPDLLSNPLVSIIPIPTPSQLLQTNNRWLFLLCAPLKVLWQIWSLCAILGYRTKPARWLLVQNPPSIPTLAVACVVCFLRDTHLLIDWHNFGWSILALKLGRTHPLVNVAKRYEFYFGRFATANFTVTNAMARVLKESHKIRSPIFPLHDRPPKEFQPLALNRRIDFLSKLPITAPWASALAQGTTRLLVSSTSWTPDEDFSLLLDALVRYSTIATERQQSLPTILAVITGKGPQKEYYVSRISSLAKEQRLEKVTVITTWLSNADYAALLGSADLGVSLHKSSSGLDLPMKVVDMFGAGLPVVGWNGFEAWKELVKEGVNGTGFVKAEELGETLTRLFGDGEKQLEILRRGAKKEGETRWDDEWYPVAGRVFGLKD
ncbi:MAG: mannosyltransferase [Sclerophora amabilis]|nr:MAG: mannosyltransferase [Sclerophora amabilis]